MPISPLGLNGIPQQQYIQNVSTRLQEIIARIVSGHKLGEDVAALSIASQLQSETAGLKQVAGNIAQASSLTQVADGGAAQVQHALEQLQTLASQAASPVLTPEVRDQLDQQFQQLAGQLDQLANGTTFNGQPLLSGSLVGDGALALDTILAGDNGPDGLKLAIPNLSQDGLLGGENLNLQTVEGAQAAFVALGEALNAVTAARAGIGAFQSALDFSAATIDSAITNQDAARATLGETDLAETSTQLSLADVQQNAAVAVQAQTNNLAPAILKLIS